MVAFTMQDSITVSDIAARDWFFHPTCSAYLKLLRERHNVSYPSCATAIPPTAPTNFSAPPENNIPEVSPSSSTARTNTTIDVHAAPSAYPSILHEP